jgi:NAD/NADP transhydrogenase alpha subunit
MLALIVNKEKQLQLDMNDEVVAGAVVCTNGSVVHPLLKPAGAA